MDDNRIEGANKQIKGSIKKAVGKITGDDSLQAEGAVQKTAGKIQEGYGQVKDEVRATREKGREERR